MRTWFTYETSQDTQTIPNLSPEYFVARDYGRLLKYFIFIRKNLGNAKKILSVGAGDCVLEYQIKKKLMVEVKCTDIKTPAEIFKTAGIDYSILDITREKPEGTYDAVICMSTMFLLEAKQLQKVFENISSCLKPGGILIIDYGGSPPNFISDLMINIYLPVEMRMYSLVKGLPLFKSLKGYRMSTEEIVRFAERNGFTLASYEPSFDINDLRRSMVFRKLFPPDSYFEKWIAELIKGRNPYLRLMAYVKKERG